MGLGALLAIVTTKQKSDQFAPKVDSVAEQMEDTGEKMSAPDGGGAVSLTYSTLVIVSTEEQTAEIIFENPSRSTKDAALQLFLKGEKEGQEKLLAESELIPAGYKLSEMKLKDHLNLNSGNYEGVMVVSYYDPESGEKEVVDTNIPVSVTVNNGY